MGQLHIRLDDDEKEDWREYADEQGYGSLSRFVRTVVSNERDDSTGGGQSSQQAAVPSDVATADDLQRLNDTLLRVTDRLESVEERLENLEQDSVRPRDEQAVLAALPEGRPSAEHLDSEWVKDGDPDWEKPNAGTALDGRPESVAVVADERVSAVEYFLNQAAERTDSIQSAVIDGEQRYWKEGEGDE